jgi:hypothetical protein
VQNVAQGHALEIEVQDQQGNRPMRLRMDKSWLGIDRKNINKPPVHIETDEWYQLDLTLDSEKQMYTLSVNGEEQIKDIPFAEKTSKLERIVFRTGPFRGHVPPAIAEDAFPKPAGLESEDLPGADKKAPLCVYWIDDVKISRVN